MALSVPGARRDSEPRPQRSILHHQRGEAGRSLQTIDRRDVRMIERSQNLKSRQHSCLEGLIEPGF